MKTKINPLSILIVNIYFSIVLYIGILMQLVMHAKISILVFPITIVIHNIIIWLLALNLEKHI